MRMTAFALPLIFVTTLAFAQGAARARTLKDVMDDMAPRLQSLIKGPLDESAIPAADGLKKFSLEAAEMAPPSLAPADALGFEALLLQIALKSNQLESALLAKDTTAAAELVKAISGLKTSGHLNY